VTSGRGVNLMTAGRGVNLMQVLGLAQDIKCPVCHKVVPADDGEMHLVICLTRPRITYNDDVLIEDKGECPICFEEMLAGFLKCTISLGIILPQNEESPIKGDQPLFPTDKTNKLLCQKCDENFSMLCFTALT